jgi:hypothetical protein
MSIQDERELRERLGGLLHGIEPGLPPVTGTMRRGRGIRMRRWVTAAAGVAVLAAGAVVLPGLLRAHQASPMGQLHYKVTVNAIGKDAKPGLIGQGTTNGLRWSAVMSVYGAHGVSLTGHGLPNFLAYQNSVQFNGKPAALAATGGVKSTVLEFGTVQADVTTVVISLPDGEVISLVPVSWHGRRWVAVLLPARVPIVRALLYTTRGELAYAVPHRGTELDVWWRPGQVGPARLRVPLGSGVVDGRPWHAAADIGPWGYCYSFGSSGSCIDTTVNPALVPAGTLVSPMTCGSLAAAGPGQPVAGFGAAAPAVRRIVLKYADGSTAIVPTVAVGPARMFGYAIPGHHRVVRALMYGASGQLLGSTPGATWAC